MEKIRLTDRYHDLFRAEKTPSIIETPRLAYIAINGKGPLFKNPSYNNAVGLLQGIAFFTKFRLKEHPPEWFVDYYLPPFEAIWRNTEAPKEERKWKVMLLQPDFVTADVTEHAYLTAKKKQEQDNDITIPKMIFQEEKPGTFIQVLHTQAYTAQQDSIQLLATAAAEKWYELTGKQHEIYIKDPRKFEKIGSEIIIRRWVKKKK